MKDLKLVRSAFDDLRFAFDHATINWANRLHEECKGEERGHRTWGSDFAAFHPNAASVSDVAKMFAVRRVAEYLNGAAYPMGADYLHFQKSCFIAAGMAAEFKVEILAAWKGYDLAALVALDYCDYVKVEHAAVTV